MNARWLLAIPTALLAGGLVLAACGGGGSKAGEPHRHGNETWEKEASLKDMPSFLDDYSGRTRHLYSVVGKYEEVMKTVNCYCGCMDYEDAHDSLHRCYIAEHDETGVTWTDHSGQCGICTEELAKIEEWTKAGKTKEEIQQLIEQNFNPNA